ncbi:Beta-glucosidase 11 [Morella rubra]|uniref:Beta-glucosidase 11 n=1 Tax=Morella rubra TaxID=262757 RepID=A0A6A1WNB4_9ROSI|nr:Beta-glucosidase 11 [Morella rubra]
MQDKQHGFIGINVFAYWIVPLTNTTEDAIAAQRVQDFMIGWYLDPLVYGDYPDVMRKNVGSRLPAFTTLESNQVKGSLDFVGVNYYNTLYVKDNSRKLEADVRNFDADMAVDLILITNPAFNVLAGQRTRHNSSLEDWPRVKSLHGYIGGLLEALRNGSNARGYFQWSFLDLFEMLDGYESSYGLYYIGLDDPDLKRQPKLSAYWYSHFLKRKGDSSDGFIELEKNLTALPSHAYFFQ